MKRLSLLLVLFSWLLIPSFAQKKPVVTKKQPVKTVTVTEADLSKAYRAADYAKAIDIADQLLSVQPHNQRILVIRAMSYAMVGNKEMARKTADILYPYSLDTEGNFLAVLPLNLSKEIMKRDAAWYVAEGHKLAPSSPIVYMVESSIYLDDSAYDKAMAAAKKGMTLMSPNYSTAVYAQLANLLHMSGGIADAYTFINKLAAAHPNDSSIETTRYAMLQRDKKYPEALTVLNNLSTQYPADKRLRKERAFLYEDMDRHGDACADALKLSEEDDDYFPLLRKLGCPQAFANLSPAHVKSYTYDVDYHGMKYQFIVQPFGIKMNEGANFNWKMTVRDDMLGAVTISKEALDTAHAQMNKFSAGSSSLSNQTSVWVSNSVYGELKKNGKSMINAGESGPKTFTVVTDDSEPIITDASGHTKALSTLHIRSDDQTEELWINDDAANPIITRMNLGWSIELKSIQ